MHQMSLFGAATSISMLLLALVLTGTGAAAEDTTTSIDIPDLDSAIEDRAVSMTLRPPARSEKQTEWVFLPIPKANPAIGGGLQLVAARFFQADAKSQTSVLGAGAGYYSSDTWFAAAGGAVNFSEDRWRVSGGLGYIDAKYDFYGVGSDAGSDGIRIPINQTASAAFVSVLRRVWANWYIGGGYRYLDSQAGLNVSLPGNKEIEDILKNGVHIVSAGPTLAASYDTRDLNMNPRTGSYITIDAIFPSKNFGSDANYDRVKIKANGYWPTTERITLAGRFSLCGASANTPFFDICYFGADSDLRGYVVGRYQDLTKFAVQGEVRTQFTARWGGVVFAGVGQVAPTFHQMTDDNLLPAAGFGVRWMAAPKNKVNIRADVAWGEDGDALFYLSVGEAF
jgi:outer membrane protein assembly factor BamA